MAVRKLNVLVYTGTGTTSESVRHCMFTLRELLTPNYAVIPVTEATILKEPWASTCALLVFPGGGDLGYCRVLNGEGNRHISNYVRRGGAYLGFCAGSYYGSGRCEFEVGNQPLEVIGSRELAFFPGTCRGGAFKGFEYQSERGARAVKLRVASERFNSSTPVPTEVTSYYNGGGVFVDAANVKGRKVEVLATYQEETAVDGGGQGEPAAVVFCTVGDGRVLLSGPHPEFSAVNLHAHPDLPEYESIITKLAAADESRLSFVKACLTKLGLDVSETKAVAPTLTSLHLSSIGNIEVTELLYILQEVMEKENGQEYIKDEGDTFHIKSKTDALDMGALKSSLSDSTTGNGHGIVDYGKVMKVIVPHEESLPSSSDTPKFDHKLFYSSVRRYQLTERGAEDWGKALLYGEVVTSTNTLLEKNPKLLGSLPNGFTLAASTQVAGRGRGSNVWIAPPGSLIFSTVITHPAHLAMTRPIVFIQYISAIAVAEAVRSYGEGYENVPIKLKWPNDIFALDPTSPKDNPSYVKIGGIRSHCGYSNGAYQVVVGIGVNTLNPKPTTSLADLIPAGADPLHIETLLARVLTRLEAIYAQFLREGFSADFEARYYRHWLHTGQAVQLEAEGGVRGRVLGITRDWGMLRVERTDDAGRGTGEIWTLQSDENSFDYWKGLVRRKT